MAKDLSVGTHLPRPGLRHLLAAGHPVRAARASCSRRSTGRRPTSATGRRVSIVIPAFNEEDGIGRDDRRLLRRATTRATGSTSWSSTTARRDEHLGADARGARPPPDLVCVQLPRTTAASAPRWPRASGARRADICAFVDSDSVHRAGCPRPSRGRLRRPAGRRRRRPRRRPEQDRNWLSRMQQVRYYVAFRVIKGSESMFGAVTCASGCFSAYRRTALLRILDRWENQHFLGRQSTFGDDRALTNYILRDWRVMYQSQARLAHPRADAPARLRRSSCAGRSLAARVAARQPLHVAQAPGRRRADLLRLPLPVGRADRRCSTRVYFRAVGVGSPLFYLVGAYVMARPLLALLRDRAAAARCGGTA